MSLASEACAGLVNSCSQLRVWRSVLSALRFGLSRWIMYSIGACLCIASLACAPAAASVLGALKLSSLATNLFCNQHDAGHAKQQKKWSPARPQAIRRKEQLRERRLIKQGTRCLARYLKQIHTEHGHLLLVSSHQRCTRAFARVWWRSVCWVGAALWFP